MKALFCENFDQCSQFIFDFYDINKSEAITKEDIRTVLSYVALNKENKSNFESYGYTDRVTSQEELCTLLDNSFKNISGDSITYPQFVNIIENVSSDIYFLILFFLLEKRPFTKKSIIEYTKQMEKKPINSESPKRHHKRSITKLVASPASLNSSTFSPSLTFIRETKKRKTVQLNQINFNENPLVPQRNKEKHNTSSSKKGISLFLKSQLNQTPQNQIEQESKKIEDLNPDEVPVKRKTKTYLKDIKEQHSRKEARRSTFKYKDLSLMPAFKQSNFQALKNKEIIGDGESLISGDDNGDINPENDTEVVEIEEDPQIHSDPKLLNFDNSLDDEDKEDNENEDVVKHEGFLYKMIDSTKLKKLWFKLLHKDLYFFKTDKDLIHKGMHNLSGVFLREEPPEILANIKFFIFTIIYPKKERKYYVDNESQYKLWIAKLKVATGYTNLTDIYHIDKKLGNGKFGLVRLGIHKQSGKRVAIKIMSKKEMDTQDLELVRTEMEILKICQHPNIISLYETFENVDYFYIIMEYCEGSDLFYYIEKRGFRLTEERACSIVHKICAAVFYIHSYGIAHRDIKPENVLMTSMGDNADIRILDFGLSKIIGSGEYCTEPYGTLSYVAPEVLQEKPYNKAVDIWSLGVTAYLLLSGTLPFDDPNNEREIARQTINDPVPFKGNAWTTISSEAVDFVLHMLDKNPNTRFTIKEALDHPWLKKFALKTKEKKDSIPTTSMFQIYSST